MSIQTFLRLTGLLLAMGLANHVAAQCTNPPSLTLVPPAPDNVYCPYDTVKLSAGAYDTYQWFYTFNPNNMGTLLAETPTLQLPAGEWAGTYFYVTVTEGNCTYTSAPTLIDGWVFLFPAIEHSSNLVYCRGDSSLIQNAFGSWGAYQWYLDGEPIAGATQATLWVRESGTYVLEVSPEVCPLLTLNSGVGPTFMFLGPEPPVISQQGATLVSSSGPTYQWYRNGQAIAGATQAEYTPSQSGEYTVRVSDSSGCALFSAAYTYTLTAGGEPAATAGIRCWPSLLSPGQQLQWENSRTATAEVQLFDAVGRRLDTWTLPAQSQGTLALDHLPRGWYMLDLVAGPYRQRLPLVVQ